jgi:hypothetical protein
MRIKVIRLAASLMFVQLPAIPRIERIYLKVKFRLEDAGKSYVITQRDEINSTKGWSLVLPHRGCHLIP